MDESARLDAELDPCPRRTSSGAPCERPRHHVGQCGESDEKREMYRKYIAALREHAKTMKRSELDAAVEYHLLTWRVLRNEYNAR